MSLIPRKFPLEKLKQPRADRARPAIPWARRAISRGWCEMVSAYGTKKLPELFAPAIAVARDGFGLIEFNVEEIGGVTCELRSKDKLYPEWSRTYLEGITGGRPALGAMLKQPDLARTLEALAAEGPALMYGGALGKKLVERLAELGGTLTMDDLMDFKVQWIDPVAAALSRPHHPRAAAALRGVPVPADPAHPRRLRPRRSCRATAPTHIDTVLRAIRIAAGVRIANGVPSQQKLAELPVGRPCREPAGAGARRQAGGRARPSSGRRPANEGHTTSFSIADKHGNMVCVAQSLGSVFGSGVVVPGTGICLNNFLYWADVNPGQPQPREEGRRSCRSAWRPRSSPRTSKPVLALSTAPAATASCRPRCRRWCSTSISACRCSRRSKRHAQGSTTAAPCCRESRGRCPGARRAALPSATISDRGPDWTMKVGRHAGRGALGRHLHRRLRSEARRLRAVPA